MVGFVLSVLSVTFFILAVIALGAVLYALVVLAGYYSWVALRGAWRWAWDALARGLISW